MVRKHKGPRPPPPPPPPPSASPTNRTPETSQQVPRSSSPVPSPLPNSESLQQHRLQFPCAQPRPPLHNESLIPESNDKTETGTVENPSVSLPTSTSPSTSPSSSTRLAHKSNLTHVFPSLHTATPAKDGTNSSQPKHVFNTGYLGNSDIKFDRPRPPPPPSSSHLSSTSKDRVDRRTHNSLPPSSHKLTVDSSHRRTSSVGDYPPSSSKDFQAQQQQQKLNASFSSRPRKSRNRSRRKRKNKETLGRILAGKETSKDMIYVNTSSFICNSSLSSGSDSEIEKSRSGKYIKPRKIAELPKNETTFVDVFNSTRVGNADFQEAEEEPETLRNSPGKNTSENKTLGPDLQDDSLINQDASGGANFHSAQDEELPSHNSTRSSRRGATGSDWAESSQTDQSAFTGNNTSSQAHPSRKRGRRAANKSSPDLNASQNKQRRRQKNQKVNDSSSGNKGEKEKKSGPTPSPNLSLPADPDCSEVLNNDETTNQEKERQKETDSRLGSFDLASKYLRESSGGPNKIADVVSREVFEKRFQTNNKNKSTEDGTMLVYNRPPTRSRDIVRKSADEPEDFDFTQYIDVPEIIEDGADIKKMKVKGHVPFILLCRPAAVPTSEWIIPELDVFFDAVADLGNEIIHNCPDLFDGVAWANPWGQIGLIGLRPSDVKLMERVRQYIASFTFKELIFNTFPKNATVQNLELTILLRSHLRYIDIPAIPTFLFNRNPGLSGELDAHKSKPFSSTEKTYAGQSKGGWSQVFLRADAEFRKCLEKYTEDHWFSIGFAKIQIRGGVRRALTEEEKTAQARRFAGKNANKSTSSPNEQNLAASAKQKIIDQANRDPSGNAYSTRANFGGGARR